MLGLRQRTGLRSIQTSGWSSGASRSSHGRDRDTLLAFRFFKLFAQYESELKQQGFFGVNKKGVISVDWDRFANQVVGPKFKADLGEIGETADYILSHPPKRQSVNEHQQIVWADVPADDRSVQALFGHLSRMRNNLFHGAKFNGTWFDPDRSEALLSRGLHILEVYEGLLRLN